jgi:hypothetical protein
LPVLTRKRWWVQAFSLCCCIIFRKGGCPQLDRFGEFYFNFSINFFSSSTTYDSRRRRFPPKRRLLTNEEYYEQGVLETTRALEGLRDFCSSPECKQWSLMRKLKDPVRFSSFVEGSSHIVDNEILNYETSQIGEDISDDDENEQDFELVVESSDEEILVEQPQLRNGAKPFTMRNGARPNQTSTPTFATRNSSFNNHNSSRRRHAPELSEDDD